MKKAKKESYFVSPHGMLHYIGLFFINIASMNVKSSFNENMNSISNLSQIMNVKNVKQT